jgi:hypothetical protein
MYQIPFIQILDASKPFLTILLLLLFTLIMGDFF